MSEDIRYWCVQHDTGARKDYDRCSEANFLYAIGHDPQPCEWQMFQKVAIVQVTTNSLIPLDPERAKDGAVFKRAPSQILLGEQQESPQPPA